MPSVASTMLLRAAVITVVLALTQAAPAFGQDRPSPVAELAAGTLLFADNSIVREGFVGGAFRIYVTPRISVGPEVALIEGPRHGHLMLTGNITLDWLRPTHRVPRLVTPYAVVGAGLFQTREALFNGRRNTSSEGAFTAGVGVRAHPGTRLVAGVEARIGWEMHLRVNGLVGVRLGR